MLSTPQISLEGCMQVHVKPRMLLIQRVLHVTPATITNARQQPWSSAELGNQLSH